MWDFPFVFRSTNKVFQSGSRASPERLQGDCRAVAELLKYSYMKHIFIFKKNEEYDYFRVPEQFRGSSGAVPEQL